MTLPLPPSHALRVLTLLALALCAVLFGAPAWAASHALLIGIGDYKPSGLHDLPGTREDIRIMQQVLQTRFAIPPTHIQVLQDEQATHRGVEQAFRQLGERVAPGDFVYIHYSGHGSFVRDANADEWRTGQDQTWVSHGARRGEGDGLDRFDILDDELNQWLGPIAERAGELIYVADACHSASNTRGEQALVARAAPPSAAEHPLGQTDFPPYSLAEVVRIGAARDDQSAHEFTDDQGQPHGLFTWHWAHALQQARPEETWRQLFERASLGVQRSHGHAQQPQLAGAGADRPILGGELKTRPAVMVTEVDADASGVTLNAGRLSGVNVGSRFGHPDPEEALRIRITESAATWSKGVVEEGAVTVGAFLAERERAYTTAPLKLNLLPPRERADQALAETLRSRIAADSLPGFVLADGQAQADLVLALLRPRRTQGRLHYPVGPEGRATLPEEAPEAAPELWVLTPGERLLHERLIFPLSDPEAGLAQLERNLARYRRVREIQHLAAQSGRAGDIKLALIGYAPCEPGSAACHEIAERHYRRQPGTQPLDRLTGQRWRIGDLISFELANPGRRDRYVYLFDIAADGEIAAIFPSRDMAADQARLKGGERLDLDREGAGLLIDRPGEENLLLLATRAPIDPFLLEQSGYEAVRTRGASLNPLEQLLSSAVHGNTRGSVVGTRSGSWGLSTFAFQVVGEGEAVDPIKKP